jgi:hypothetical protein
MLVHYIVIASPFLDLWAEIQRTIVTTHPNIGCCPLIWLSGFADENKGDIAMSMTAFFVQVEDAEIARFEADPDSVEALFADQALPTAGLLNMTAAMQERLRATGPQMMAETLSRLPEPLRQQIEASLGRTTAALASGQGGDDILKLVLGGVELGDDAEGFSGYGPARYFRAARVRELSEELRRPEVEAEAAARFDPAKMSQLNIYPGWRAGEQDKEWLMDAFQRLRGFYSNASAQGRAIITCLL